MGVETSAQGGSATMSDLIKPLSSPGLALNLSGCGTRAVAFVAPNVLTRQFNPTTANVAYAPGVSTEVVAIQPGDIAILNCHRRESVSRLASSCSSLRIELKKGSAVLSISWAAGICPILPRICAWR